MDGIFLAVFDDDAGPVVACEVPRGRGCLGPKLFDRVSDFVITKKELCGSLLTVSDPTSQRQVMSCPLFVENARVYSRNTFFFTFGFVFAEGAQTGPFDAVLRKLVGVMRSLEEQAQFVSREDCAARLEAVLQQVFEQLSRWGECVVFVDESAVLALKVVPRLVDPPEVLDFQVPIQVRDLSAYVAKEWDLTIQQVVNFIDGERHVRLIAEASGVAVTLARRCIRQLLYFRCVRMVDIFQYSNKYVCTPRLAALPGDPALRRECAQYVWTRRGAAPSWARIFRLFCALHPCLALKDFCLLNDTAALNVSDRRFVAFGVLHGLIRRVHSFPVLAPDVDKAALLADGAARAAPLYVANVQARLARVALGVGARAGARARGAARGAGFDGDDDDDDDDDDDNGGGGGDEEEEDALRLPEVVGGGEELATLANGRNCFDAIATARWQPTSHIAEAFRKIGDDIVIVEK